MLEATRDPLAVVRYVDVVLVVLAAPFVVLLGAPVLGYAVGAAVWIIQRFIGASVERRARHHDDVRKAVGMTLGTLVLRAWLVGLTILAVGLAGERKDGLMAALLMLVAFTVYFAMSLILRPLERSNPQR
jgi:peptidoglycan biosynthesis protein MviN/MurJ (putative lipid II flippase)